MYIVDGGWWFNPNAPDRFTVSMRDKPKFNTDGSLTLYFRNESPGTDKEANLLPAAKGEFVPMLRMYWPREIATVSTAARPRQMDATTGHARGLG
jgi:hypothetical protein